MKIGMNLLLWTETPDESHVSLFPRMKDWGFDGVEFPLDALSSETADTFAAALRDLHMGATGIVAMPADAADPIHPDAQLRAAAVRYLERCIELAARMGIRVIAGPLFQGLGRFTGIGPTQQEKEWCAETISAVLPCAKRNGIVLAGEPINRFETYFINTIDQAIEIVDLVGSDHFGIHADTCHGNIEESDVAAAWKRAGSRIKHIHISENTRGIPGTGHACGADIFKTVNEIGYDGWLTIEGFGIGVQSLVDRLHIWRPFAPQDEDIARLGCAYIRTQLSKSVK